MTCEFCGESEIADLSSYKGHLQRCEEFKKTLTPAQVLMKRLGEQ